MVDWDRMNGAQRLLNTFREREWEGGRDTYDGNFDCSRLIGHRVVVSLEF